MRFRLTKTFAALRHVVSKDHTRPALRDVNIQRVGEREGYAVGTDGYQLWTVPIEIDQRTIGNAPKQSYMPTDILDNAAKVLGKKLEDPTNVAIVRKTGAFIETVKDGTTVKDGREFTNPDTPYPAWPKAWPEDNSPHQDGYQPLSLGTEMLTNLLQFLRDADALGVVVWVPIRTDRAPSVSPIPATAVRNEGAIAEGMLMPIRIDDSINVPDPAGIVGKRFLEGTGRRLARYQRKGS